MGGNFLSRCPRPYRFHSYCCSDYLRNRDTHGQHYHGVDPQNGQEDYRREMLSPQALSSLSVVDDVLFVRLFFVCLA